jgi:hypothetical protein
MIGNLLIPIIDMGEMEYTDNFKRNVIGKYGSDNEKEMYIEGDNSVISNMYANVGYDDDYTVHDVKQNVKMCECECYVTDSDNNDITTDFFDGIVDSGKMSIIKININPNTVDDDCESELKLWIAESNKLLDDTTIDNRTKIKHLPKKDVYFVFENKKYKLNNSKIFAVYKINNAPFYFAALVEKITSEK